MRQIEALNVDFKSIQRASGAPSSAFAAALLKTRPPKLARYPKLACGEAIALAQCPDIRAGWPAAAIEMNITTDDEFKVPTELAPACEEYLQVNKFRDDRRRFMLTRAPTVFTDDPTLILDVRPTRYSRCKFYSSVVSKMASISENYADDLIVGSKTASFAHTFALHLVVVTSDNKVLLTQRPSDVGYYPNTWSASLEEQLDDQDFEQNKTAGPVLTWFRRSMHEELGLDSNAALSDQCRVLSIFYESDCLNVAMCGIVRLSMPAVDLATILRSGSGKKDDEVTRFEFLDLTSAEMLGEIFRPTRNYHPTSRYRLLNAFLKTFGGDVSPRLLDELAPAT